MSQFVQQILAIKSRVVRKANKCKGFWPPFFRRDDPNCSTADC